MGLLDFQNKLPGLLQDDNFRMGLQLLAAAGPSATPMSAGQRIQQGLMAFQQQKDAEEDRKLKREWTQAQIGGQQAKAAQQAQVQALLGRFTQPGGAGVAGMSPGDMLALKAAGVDPTEIVKYAGQGNKFDPGSVYQNPTTGAVMHVPKVADGVQLNPDGSAALLPGYAQATGQLEGAKQWAGVAPTLATEAGKAGIAAKNDLVQVYNPATQSMQFVPRSQVLGAAGPAGYASEPQMRVTAQGDMGGKLADLDKEIAATQRDLKNPNLDAGSRQQLEQHVATLQGQRDRYYGPGPMQAGPSAAEKTAAAAAQAGAVDQAKADVAKGTKRETEMRQFDRLGAVMGEAIDLLKQGPTASLGGAGIDALTNAIGLSTKGADLAQRLEALSGWAVANVPRMEGPQSDRDVLNYVTMAGRVGDRSMPIKARIAAAEQVQALMKKYAQQDGGAAPAEPAPSHAEKFNMTSYSDADIKNTALKYGLTPEQVKKRLGVQ